LKVLPSGCVTTFEKQLALPSAGTAHALRWLRPCADECGTAWAAAGARAARTATADRIENGLFKVGLPGCKVQQCVSAEGAKP
jgi:hypothetical protein